MQHPDEGTIHSWLDGELSHEEAAEMESHVAACSSCAAAVAEARGFVAASSRILTALDEVPGGVIPAAPHRTRDLRVFWRAAAAMLVVAGGSLVVMRDGGQDATVSKAPTEGFTASAPVSSALDGTGSTDATGSTADGATVGQVDENAASQRPATPSAPRVGRGAASSERDLTLRAERRSLDATEGTSAGTRAPSGPPTAPLAMESSAAPPSSEAVPLKVLSVERRIGSRRTTYEIAPSQTVVLTEYLSAQLSEVVVTGAASENQRQAPANARAVEPRRVEAAPPPAPPVMRDSRSAADSATTARPPEAVAKASVGQIQAGAAFAAAVTTISWTDPSTGNTLTLSGKVPVERLQQIKRQLERERGAARAKIP